MSRLSDACFEFLWCLWCGIHPFSPRVLFSSSAGVTSSNGWCLCDGNTWELLSFFCMLICLFRVIHPKFSITSAQSYSATVPLLEMQSNRSPKINFCIPPYSLWTYTHMKENALQIYQKFWVSFWKWITSVWLRMCCSQPVLERPVTKINLRFTWNERNMRTRSEANLLSASRQIRDIHEMASGPKLGLYQALDVACCRPVQNYEAK